MGQYRLGGRFFSVIGRRVRRATTNQQQRRSGADRRKEPRALFRDNGQDAQNRVFLSFGDFRCQIRDLSKNGIAFYVQDSEGWAPTLGSLLSATLVVDTFRADFQLKVASWRDEVLGCSIEGADAGWEKFAADLLDPIRLGVQLRDVTPHPAPIDAAGLEVHDFRSELGCDLVIWKRPGGAITAVQLLYMGQVAEWSARYGERTGRVAEVPAAASPEPSRRTALHPPKGPRDREVLHLARRVLAAASLPEPLQLFLIAAGALSTSLR